MNNKKPFLYGVLGAFGLIGIYFMTLSILNTFDYALSQFANMWYWFMSLAIGFGVQLGLYVYIKTFDHEKIKGAAASVATSGGVSTGAMIACCLHHVADFLPLLGLSAAAIFLTKYQVPFIVLGIFSNVIGITLMLKNMQKHKIFETEGVLEKLFKLDMNKTLNIVITISIFIVSYSFFIET